MNDDEINIKTRKKYRKPKEYKIAKNSRRVTIDRKIRNRPKPQHRWLDFHKALYRMQQEVGSNYVSGRVTLYSALDIILIRSYEIWNSMPKKNNMDDTFNDFIEYVMEQMDAFKNGGWEEQRKWKVTNNTF